MASALLPYREGDSVKGAFHVKWETKVEPRDLWIGLYWDQRNDGLHLYFACFGPLLHLRIVRLNA